MRITSCCPQIEELDVSYCPELTFHSFNNIAFSLALLTSLNVSGCDLLENDSLIFLAQKCDLRELDISYCRLITNNGINALAKYSPNLKSLNILKIYQITDSSIINLSSKCKQLVSFTAGYNNISCNSLNSFLKLDQKDFAIRNIQFMYCFSFIGSISTELTSTWREKNKIESKFTLSL